MKLDNIRGFSGIDEYVRYKLDEYSHREKDFASLFEFMFDETDNIMAESSDGYRIKKITYGQFKERIISIAPTLSDLLSDVKEGSVVGLYMSNSIEWIELFWAILMCGYKALLMNTRLSDEVLEGIIEENGVSAVISDGKTFSVKTVRAEEAAVASDKALSERKFGDEVIFMSSGTTESVKLCSYTGENFYYQICDSVNIVKQCPDIKRHFEGQLKQLVLLPFCHVFGFIAVYIWFGFFSRTFVFPKDLNPQTIQNTVKKHKVTHIFAVPMVWEAVHKAALQKIRARSEKTYKKFCCMLSLTSKMGGLGNLLAKRFFREVREGLFGDSIQFLISGGSHIDPETLKFFNGIGYHIANGYGMTEIGITSVEKARSKKILNTASIGAPFGYTAYSVGDDGELLVKGKTRAAKITQSGVSILTDYDSLFHTNDLVRCEKGRYFIEGRKDDLIVSDSGENLNPVLAEGAIRVSGVERCCVFPDDKNNPVLLASVPGCFSAAALKGVYSDICEALKAAKLEGVIRKVFLTAEPLVGSGEIKLNRRKIKKRFGDGSLRVIDPRNIEKHVAELVSGLMRDVRACFAEVLSRDEETIGVGDNFFSDLEGTSLDYFELLGLIRSRFGVQILNGESEGLLSVNDFCKRIKGE